MATLTNIPRHGFSTTRETVIAPFAIQRVTASFAAWRVEHGLPETVRQVRMRKSGLRFVVDVAAWMEGGRWAECVLSRPLEDL